MFNFKKNENYRSIAVYAALVIIISAVIILAIINHEKVANVIKNIFDTLSPFTYGFVFAYLCNPILVFYETKIFTFKNAKKDRKKLRRALSLSLTLLTAVAIIVVIAWAVIPQTVDSINDFGSQLNTYISELQKTADDLTCKYSERIFGERYGTFGALLADHDISFNMKDIFSSFFGMFKESFNHILSAGSKFVGQVLNVLMGVFLMIYFLASKEKIGAQVKKLLAALLSRRAYINTVRLTRYTNRTFGGFIVGKIIDSAIIGVLSFIVLMIFKMPYYPLLAVIIGITNIVPTFGPFVGGAIGGIIVLIASPEDLLLFVIFVIIIQQIDGNIIGPKILGDSIGISALWVMIAIVLFGGFFGFPGMILGVPAIAVIYALVKQSAERRLKAKDMPRKTDFYAADPPAEEIEAHAVFLEKDAPIPTVTSKDDIPDTPKVKNPPITETIKNKLKALKSKGNKEK